MLKSEIIETEDFTFEGINYTARLYHPKGKKYIYGEIVYKETETRPYRKMRDIARRFLKQYGINIPTNAKSDVTHIAIQKLLQILKGDKNESKMDKI